MQCPVAYHRGREKEHPKRSGRVFTFSTPVEVQPNHFLVPRPAPMPCLCTLSLEMSHHKHDTTFDRWVWAVHMRRLALIDYSLESTLKGQRDRKRGIEEDREMEAESGTLTDWIGL